MSMLLLLLIGLGIAVIVIGGIVALIVFFAKRKQQPTVADQNLNERVKSLEIEVHAMKTKLENLQHD
tara:strand:+ start:196 stop:396 length:201 start_codon:yes stop_codon:yes gene_type:complete